MTADTTITDPRFPTLHILNHPLIVHKLSYMRDVTTSTRNFRDLLKEITLLMGYEIFRDLPMTSQKITTPICDMDAPVIAGKKVAVVPILRAGLGMADGLMELIPSARQGHVGLYRGDNNRPVEYYVRLPEMLATGYSGAHAVQVLIDRGVKPENIRFLALVAAPEGVEVFAKQHPLIPIYVAALDSHLNEKAYIVPGLGDAGDRIFGTKH
jgi:uracil phosphoribosyltransferase